MRDGSCHLTKSGISPLMAHPQPRVEMSRDVIGVQAPVPDPPLCCEFRPRQLDCLFLRRGVSWTRRIGRRFGELTGSSGGSAASVAGEMLGNYPWKPLFACHIQGQIRSPEAAESLLRAAKPQRPLPL